MIKDKYYYEQLTATEKQVYNDFYKGVMKYETRIVSAALTDPKTSVKKIFSAVLNDNPHIYFLEQSFINYFYSGRETVLQPTYVLTKEQVEKYNEMIYSNGRKIMAEVIRKAGSDAQRREKVLFDYFARHCVYDHDSLETENPMVRCRAHSMLGTMLEGKGVCEGFAKAFKFILNAMDIECIMVTGNAKWETRGGHAWNIVKLHGNYYHVDVTWAINKKEDESVWYDYLNVSDEEIRLDHTGFKNVPKCTDSKLYFYKKNNLEISNKKELKELFRSCIKKHGSEVTFRLIHGSGLNGFPDSKKGLEYIKAAVTAAHQECQGTQLDYSVKYSSAKNTYKVCFNYYLWNH